MDAYESAKYECLRGNSVLPGIIREVCENLKLIKLNFRTIHSIFQKLTDINILSI